MNLGFLRNILAQIPRYNVQIAQLHCNKSNK